MSDGQMPTTAPLRRRWFRRQVGVMLLLMAVAILVALGGRIDSTATQDARRSRVQGDREQKATVALDDFELQQLRDVHVRLLGREEGLRYARGLKRNGAALPVSWCGTGATALEDFLQHCEKRDLERWSEKTRDAHRLIVADLHRIKTLQDEIAAIPSLREVMSAE